MDEARIHDLASRVERLQIEKERWRLAALLSLVALFLTLIGVALAGVSVGRWAMHYRQEIMEEARAQDAADAAALAGARVYNGGGPPFVKSREDLAVEQLEHEKARLEAEKARWRQAALMMQAAVFLIIVGGGAAAVVVGRWVLHAQEAAVRATETAAISAESRDARTPPD